MKRNIFAAIAISSFLTVFFTYTALAQETELRYKAVEGKLRYKNQIIINNVSDTEKIHVSTQIALTCQIENEMEEKAGNVLLRSKFLDISLDGYTRELQILDNEKRNVGLRDRATMNDILRAQVKDRWINLTFTPRGLVVDKFHSKGLEEVSLVNLLRASEQFLILLPEEKLEIGSRWEGDYIATISAAEDLQFMTGKAKYAFLGKVNQYGIPCYKVSVVLSLDEERSNRRVGQGSSWMTFAGYGTMYFAIDGNYLVRSNLISDLSFLMRVDSEGAESYVNFIRSKIEQNIDLIEE